MYFFFAGEKFTCYRKGRPTEVAISLSEETGEVLFEWISQGTWNSLIVHINKILLQLKCVQKKKIRYCAFIS